MVEQRTEGVRLARRLARRRAAMKMGIEFQATSSDTLMARTVMSFFAKPGDLIRITDLYGAQPADFWAFNASDNYEFLSCEHTKPSIEKLYPRLGDSAYTNKRRAIVTVVEDNSPGQHDMQFAACDPTRYAELGFEGYHPSCQENLHTALAKHGINLGFTPQPWNIFTNFFLNPDATFTVKAPQTEPGDNITLRVEMACLVVISACPQDQNMTCGGQPTDLLVEVQGG